MACGSPGFDWRVRRRHRRWADGGGGVSPTEGGDGGNGEEGQGCRGKQAARGISDEQVEVQQNPEGGRIPGRGGCEGAFPDKPGCDEREEHGAAGEGGEEGRRRVAVPGEARGAAFPFPPLGGVEAKRLEGGIGECGQGGGDGDQPVTIVAVSAPGSEQEAGGLAAAEEEGHPPEGDLPRQAT